MYLKEIMYEDTNLAKGWLPYYVYAIMVDNREVGKLVFRLGTNQQRYYDGHIGYTIDNKYRGNNFAYKAVLLLKDIITDLGFNEVIITCSPDNIASKKTIMKLGCQYLETKEIPSKLKKDFAKNEKIKEIYLMKL